jgi:hypothetical protein
MKRDYFERKIAKYNKKHPIRIYYVHRWPDGRMSPFCREGPAYQFTTGSIWPGSMFYQPMDPAERWTLISAFDRDDAIEQAKQIPEWEWKIVKDSAYLPLIAKLKEKNPDLEVIPV